MAIQLLPIIMNGLSKLGQFPLLVSAIFGVASSVMNWFLQFMGKRLAINMTIITLVTGISVATFLAIETLILTLKFFVPPEASAALSLIYPTNFTACASAIFGAKVIRWVWEWKTWALIRFYQ